MTKQEKGMLHSVRESLVTFTGRGSPADDDDFDREFQSSSKTSSWAQNAKSKLSSFMSRHPEPFKSMAFAVAGEFLATFLFMFLIKAPFINNDRQLEPENLAFKCIVVGFATAGTIFAFYEISGGHLNPLVTHALVISGKMNFVKAILYVIAQLLASVFATLYIDVVFPPMPGDPMTSAERLAISFHSGTPTYTGFWMEFTLSFILIFFIFATMDPIGSELRFAEEEEETSSAHKSRYERYQETKEKTIQVPFGAIRYGISPIPIGLVVGVLCTIGSSSSGGAFNPAAVFGPALVSGNWDHHASYWFGGLLGTSFAVLVHEVFFTKPKIKARQLGL